MAAEEIDSRLLDIADHLAQSSPQYTQRTVGHWSLDDGGALAGSVVAIVHGGDHWDVFSVDVDEHLIRSVHSFLAQSEYHWLRLVVSRDQPLQWQVGGLRADEAPVGGARGGAGALVDGGHRRQIAADELARFRREYGDVPLGALSGAPPGQQDLDAEFPLLLAEQTPLPHSREMLWEGSPRALDRIADLIIDQAPARWLRIVMVDLRVSPVAGGDDGYGPSIVMDGDSLGAGDERDSFVKRRRVCVGGAIIDHAGNLVPLALRPFARRDGAFLGRLGDDFREIRTDIAVAGFPEPDALEIAVDRTGQRVICASFDLGLTSRDIPGHPAVHDAYYHLRLRAPEIEKIREQLEPQTWWDRVRSRLRLSRGW
ncbi:hypothetical protein [Devriesea agamarum]|uniref:hypothetical protein n=1 Tax=Devriesea agamarum TaxID=472569 RepID=UPI00071C894F|nr:hypothetical protein [Devriesea agamarum]